MAASTKSRRQTKPKAQTKTPATEAGEKPSKAADQAQREAVREAAAEKKAAERKAAIDSGALIVDGDVEFREVTERAKDTIDQRTRAVIERLRSAEAPVMAKELHEELGGAYALYIPVYSTLLALGLVRRFRRSSGERGGSGIAYVWSGD